MKITPVPIIDLFAGPGGLGEGFAALKMKGHRQQAFFEIGLSIEKDPVAHRTLTLRSVFRRLRGTDGVKHYYRYIRGEIDEATFRSNPVVAAAFDIALTEAQCLELGKSAEAEIDDKIRAALNGRETWVLIGGPPCQAYSVAGRSRRANDRTFHKDERHTLYTEYLRIIRVHKPAIFVMENVKGLLSSKHSGRSMFKKILADLATPDEGFEYEIRSFTKRGNSTSLEPLDYIVQSERYGIPQCRHRVILLGVRKNMGIPQHQLLAPISSPVTVSQTIGDLPRIRSRLSRRDTLEAWYEAVQASPSYLADWSPEIVSSMLKAMEASFADHAKIDTTGASFIRFDCRRPRKSDEIQWWLHDKRIEGVCQHESRAHMPSDLARYLFSSCYAQMMGRSPRLEAFPNGLLPDHINVQGESDLKAIPFNDRFRVQQGNEPATTVVAHIAKDGHYYIHYDPSQCRSLTVREAARLQTFPDNYFFAGNRTEQYTQVGNAVPPLLAYKLARIVRKLLNEMDGSREKQAPDTAQEMPSKRAWRSFSELAHVLPPTEVDLYAA